MKKFTVLLVLLVIFTAFGLAACTNTDTGYDVVKQTKMDNFTLLNQTAKEGQIVIIGDSIVELYPTYELFPELEKTVYNRGISGDTSDKLLERLETNALNIKPDVLCILIGTNDLGRGVSADAVTENVKEMLVAAKTAGINKIVVQSVYPLNRSINASMVGGRNNKDTIALNEKLQRVALENGAEFADVFNALTDKDGNFDAALTYDGLHPNAAGYIKISEVLLPYFA